MMAAGSIHSTGSMVMLSLVGPAIALGIAFLAYTLYNDPQMRAEILKLYEQLPQMALYAFEKAVEMYKKMEEGFVPEQLQNLGLGFEKQY